MAFMDGPNAAVISSSYRGAGQQLFDNLVKLARVASEIRSDAAEAFAFVLACEAAEAANMSERISFVLRFTRIKQALLTRRLLRACFGTDRGRGLVS